MNLEKSQPQYTILPKERELLLRICDEDLRAVNWLYQIRAIAHKSQDVPYVAILEYLVKNKITGYNFIHFIEVEHERSPVNAVAKLRKLVFKDYKVRKLFAKGRKTNY